MRAQEFVFEGQNVRQEIENMATILPGKIDEYFVRFTDQDKIGFSARQHFGRTPDVDDSDFASDRLAQRQGRPALWFYPLRTYLRHPDVYAGNMPYTWLVRIKPGAWLQRLGQDAKDAAPQGQRRVGMLRHDQGVPMAVFFEPAFDVVDRWHETQQLDEYSVMAGGIKTYLQKRGYRFLGAGVDQMAFSEPGTGYVLKIFGTDCGGNRLSPDQEMFRDFAEYCARHQQNIHLPRIYGYETFVFPTNPNPDMRIDGRRLPEHNCLYLQIRTERLRHVSNQLYPVYEAMSRAAEAYVSWEEFVEDMDHEDVYDERTSQRFQQMTTDAQSLARMHQLYETMKVLATIGEIKAYSWDLHGNNIMERSDGTPVITDPWIVA